jgi:hypothetical protein
MVLTIHDICSPSIGKCPERGPGVGRNWRQMIQAVFCGEPPGGIVWQPRMEFWYGFNKKRGTLPDRLKDASLMDLYDELHASVRYFTSPIREVYGTVQHTSEVTDTHLRRRWVTPVGEISDAFRLTHLGLSFHPEERKIKCIEDLRTYLYVLQDTRYEFDHDAFERECAVVGDRGLPQFFHRRTPLQNLIIEQMGFEQTIYAMAEHPDEMDAFLLAAEQADDALFDALVASPVSVYNFGENIDANLDSPPIFRDRLVPYYRRRTDQLRAAGKYSYVHMDGSLKSLLPFLTLGGWDGIEAPTPAPQGDVTVEEIKQAMGDDVILLDGIPAIIFLPSWPEADLYECVESILRLFRPSRLILGISDEPPPDADFERMVRLGRWLEEQSCFGRSG